MIVLTGKDAVLIRTVLRSLKIRIDQLRGEEPAHPVGCGCGQCDLIDASFGLIDEIGKE